MSFTRSLHHGRAASALAALAAVGLCVSCSPITIQATILPEATRLEQEIVGSYTDIGRAVALSPTPQALGLQGGIEAGSPLKKYTLDKGKEALVAFCREEGIPHEICGKVIVAVDRAELSALERIYHNGQANGVQCTLIDRDRLTELEPHASGIRAIHVPEAGIVDFVAVCLRLAKRVRQRDGQIRTGTRVVGIRSVPGGVVIDTTAGEFAAQHAINCGGLYSAL